MNINPEKLRETELNFNFRTCDNFQNHFLEPIFHILPIENLKFVSKMLFLVFII